MMHPFQINSHISNDILPVKLPKESAEEDVSAIVLDLLAQMPEDFMAHRQDNFPYERYEWL
ncbi:MAG: hypothetical protein ACXWTS_10060 [Methylococcaceae bacterium]